MNHHQSWFLLVSVFVCVSAAALFGQTPFLEFGMADISNGSMSGTNSDYRDNNLVGEYHRDFRLTRVSKMTIHLNTQKK